MIGHKLWSNILRQQDFYASTLKYWRSYRETGTFIHCWWKYKMYSYLGKQLTVLKRLNINLAFNPTIALLGIYPMNENICPYKDMYVNVHDIIYSNQELEKKSKYPLSGKRIIQMQHIHSREYQSAIKIIKYGYMLQH